MIPEMIQELLQMMEKDTAINAARELRCKDVHPAAKLCNILNGNIASAIESIDSTTILKDISANLRDLHKQITSVIADVKGTCEAKIRELENNKKRFESMSREDMIARIKELEAKEANN